MMNDYDEAALFSSGGTGSSADIGDALREMEDRVNRSRVRGRNVRDLTIGELVPLDRPRAGRSYGVSPETLRDRLERERDELAEAIQVLAGQLTRRERQLAHLARYPADDPFEDGAKLEFEKRYPGSDTGYSYLALRAAGRWHLTGQRSPQNITWDRLVDFMGLGVDEVFSIGPRNGRKKVIG